MKEEIVLLGYGSTAIEFLAQNNEKINLIKCVAINPPKEEIFFGKPVEDVYEYLKNPIKGIRIIVAIKELNEVRKQLTNFGLQEFKDFIGSDFFGKMLAVIYGNCHIVPISELLRTNPMFSSKYNLCDFALYDMTSEEMQTLQNFLRNCDLFIHQAVRENNSFGVDYCSKYLISFLPNKCKIISIPNVYGAGRCFFPQLMQVGEHILDFNKYGHTLYFSIKDKYIDKAFDEGKDYIEITDAMFNDNSIFDQNEIIQEVQRTIQKLFEREKDWNIKITDYIYNNYQVKKLFYDPSHPCECLLIEIAKRFLIYMNFTTDMDVKSCRLLDRYEVPVYGCVKNALNMCWKDDILRRSGGVRLGTERFDCKTYVKEYIKLEKFEIFEKKLLKSI